jgi:hypothetical protein
MAAREDAKQERARLERIAFGPASSPEDAAAARRALADAGAAGPVPMAEAAGPAAPAPRLQTGAGASGTGDAPESTPVRGGSARTTMWSRTDAHGHHPHRRRWVALGAGIAVLAGAAFGGGIVVGQQRPDPQTTAAEQHAAENGQITLSQYLAARQTFADQLPGSVRAPVVLHSTRLVWTNRSLEADDAATPWEVYAAVGMDRSLVCLIASADGLTSTQTCAPRSVALHGTMVLVSQADSGTLTIRAVDGVVTGSVAPPS